MDDVELINDDESIIEPKYKIPDLSHKSTMTGGEIEQQLNEIRQGW